MSRGDLFAKVSFGVLDNPRFHQAEEEAPGAIALWLWLTVYSRKNETDGDVPLFVARKQSFASPSRFKHLIGTLVGTGLVRVEGGVLTLERYADHNETKAEVGARKEEARLRKQKSRNRVVTLTSKVQSRVTGVGQVRDGDCDRRVRHTTETETETETDLKPSSVPLEVRSPKGSPKAGSRLTESYQPTDETLQQCRLLGHSSPQDLVPGFIDYWIAKTGKDASKLNWEATFRNWVRSDLKRGYQGKKQLQRSGFAPAVEQTILAAFGGNNEF